MYGRVKVQYPQLLAPQMPPLLLDSEGLTIPSELSVHFFPLGKMCHNYEHLIGCNLQLKN